MDIIPIVAEGKCVPNLSQAQTSGGLKSLIWLIESHPFTFDIKIYSGQSVVIKNHARVPA